MSRRLGPSEWARSGAIAAAGLAPVGRLLAQPRTADPRRLRNRAAKGPVCAGELAGPNNPHTMPAQSIMRLLFSLAPSALVLLGSTVALGQTDLERATARDAANSGRAAFDSGQYEKAIDQFTRAEQLVHAPPHLLFLARSQAKLGKLVAAHETYLKITRETLKSNAPKAFRRCAAGGGARAACCRCSAALCDGDVTGCTRRGRHCRHGRHDLACRHDRHSASDRSGTARVQSQRHSLERPRDGDRGGSGQAKRGTPAACYCRCCRCVRLGGRRQRAAPRATIRWLRTTRSTARGCALPPMFRSASARSGWASVRTSCSKPRAATRKPANCSTNASPSIRTGDCGSIRADYDAKDSDANSQRTIGIASTIVGGVGVAAGVTFLILDVSRSEKSARRSVPHVTPVFGFNSVGLVGSF